MTTSPVTVSSDNFKEIVLRNDNTPVLVDYWATWCGPCKMMEPVLEDLAHELSGQAVIAKVEVDAQPELAGAAQIRAVPTLHLVKNGKVIDVLMGVQPKQVLLEKIEGAIEKSN
jgi:thioredoxin 1